MGSILGSPYFGKLPNWVGHDGFGVGYVGPYDKSTVSEFTSVGFSSVKLWTKLSGRKDRGHQTTSLPYWFLTGDMD